MTGKRLTVAVLLALAAGPAWAAETSTKEATKVVICHATDSEWNPYRRVTVTAAEVDGVGHVDHTNHTGPVFKPGAEKAGTNWGDIIPPGAWGPGLNWTNEGIFIHSQHCMSSGQSKPDQGLVKLCRVIHDQNGDRTDIRLTEKADNAAQEELEEAGYVPYTGALPEVCIPVPTTTPHSPSGLAQEHTQKTHYQHAARATGTPTDERSDQPGELPLTGTAIWLPLAGRGLMLAGAGLLLASRKWFA